MSDPIVRFELPNEPPVDAYLLSILPAGDLVVLPIEKGSPFRTIHASFVTHTTKEMKSTLLS